MERGDSGVWWEAREGVGGEEKRLKLLLLSMPPWLSLEGVSHFVTRAPARRAPFFRVLSSPELLLVINIVL